MPENITLEQLQSAQNEYIAAQTAKINSLEENTAAALTAFSELADRVYGYNHGAVVTDSLDAVYESIIEENHDFTELSAVGFIALLHSGDTIPTQDNILFINGTQEETDYTFSGENSEDGTELVKVWYFEKNGVLTANRINVNITDVIVKARQTTPVFSADFFNYADSVMTNINLTSVPVAVRKQKNTLGGTFNDNVSVSTQEYESYCETYPSKIMLSNVSSLKKVSFPYLKTIGGGTAQIRAFLCGCGSCEDISLPVLETIDNTPINGSFQAPFTGVPYIVIPESVKTIGSYISRSNISIVLLCKDAETIDNNWCREAPSQLFSMCSDWGASINIATAAGYWNKEQFIDLFQNRLRDMEDDVREIKVPSAIYDSLTDEEFALAEDKGWTVGA